MLHILTQLYPIESQRGNLLFFFSSVRYLILCVLVLFCLFSKNWMFPSYFVIAVQRNSFHVTSCSTLLNTNSPGTKNSSKSLATSCQRSSLGPSSPLIAQFVSEESQNFIVSQQNFRPGTLPCLGQFRWRELFFQKGEGGKEGFSKDPHLPCVFQRETNYTAEIEGGFKGIGGEISLQRVSFILFNTLCTDTNKTAHAGEIKKNA